MVAVLKLKYQEIMLTSIPSLFIFSNPFCYYRLPHPSPPLRPPPAPVSLFVRSNRERPVHQVCTRRAPVHDAGPIRRRHSESLPFMARAGQRAPYKAHAPTANGFTLSAVTRSSSVRDNHLPENPLKRKAQHTPKGKDDELSHIYSFSLKTF